MAQRYLLTCPACGLTHPVSSQQAGVDVACECGATVTAPRLGELRRLPPAEQEQPPKPSRAWSLQQGVLFSAGLAVFVVATGLALLLFLARRNVGGTERPEIPPASVEQLEQDLAELSPLATLELWEQLNEEGVKRFGAPRHVLNRKLARRLEVMIGGAAVVAVLGLASALAALVMGRASDQG